MILIYFLQHTPAPVVSKIDSGSLEEHIIAAVQGLKLFVETVGAIIIGMGVLVALYYFIRALLLPPVDNFNKIRLVLARYLALALEFQLGADILSTAIAPSWDQIGKLGAIAVIRTALNYFLSLEMKEEQKDGGEDNKERPLTSGLQKKKSDQPG